MYFQTKKLKEIAIIKSKKYFFGLDLNFFNKLIIFKLFKCVLKRKNWQSPIKINNRSINKGIPIIFQHKCEIPVYLN